MSGAARRWAARVVRGALASAAAALVAAAPSLLAAAPAAAQECPAAGAARLGLSWAEAAAAAQEAGRSADEGCAARGMALADLLDRRGRAACSAAERVAGEAGADEDATLLALRAALEWRCGRAQAAFDTARRAVARDAGAALAWRVLGKVLEARLRPRAAGAAYRRALAIDPGDTPSLAGLSGVIEDRKERAALLRQVVAGGPARREPPELVRGAKESAEFLELIGERPLWIVERAELPGRLELEPLVPGPGRVSGWIARIDVGAAEKVPVLLDSGASGLHLDRRLGQKSKIETLTAETLVGGGGSGEHDVRRGLLGRVVIGPYTFRDGLGIVAAQDSLHRTGAYRAILGLDLVGGTLLSFLPDARELRIEETLPAADDDDPLAVDPWPSRPGDVPILVVEGQLLAPAGLRTSDRDAEALMLVDTGASGTLLDTDTADLLGPYRRSEVGTTRGYGGDIGLTGLVPVATLRIGDLAVPLRDVAVIDLSLRTRLVGVHVGGFVGQDVWSRRGFTLDMASGVFRALPER